MSFLDYFRRTKPTTANVAKERLQIIVAHERVQRGQPDWMPQLQRDILDVISKYIEINRDQVNVSLDQNGDFSVLELNITLPQHEAAAVN
ncbi:MAG TPA: cell division topological specificity factor MinE [Pseudomonadales bacterium]|nr:cell division topological specificity factor MinE [Pseudomonadales bacterium]